MCHWARAHDAGPPLPSPGSAAQATFAYEEKSAGSFLSDSDTPPQLCPLLGVAARMLGLLIALLCEGWIEDNLPSVAVWVLEVAGVAAPECRVGWLEDLRSCNRRLSHDFVNFSRRGDIVAE